MRTRRKRGTALLAAGLTLVLASGCSRGGGAAHAAGVEKPDLTVAVVPAVDSAGFFVALHEDLFRDRGLNVRFVPAISSETVIAAFYAALEQGQEIADTDRAAVEAAFASLPAPLSLPRSTAAIMSLESYPVSPGPVGSVDAVRLQRVVDVMRQFIGFPPFNVDSMLMGG